MKTLKISILVLGVGLHSALAGPIALVDQENLQVSTNLLVAISAYGQSFTPTLAGIDAFELFAAQSGTITLTGASIDLRVLTLTGAIIGSSQPITGQFTANAPINFMFPSRVPLTPGQVYVAQIVNADDVVFSASFDFYPGGSVVDSGNVFGALDFKFREGLSRPVVPEPSTYILTTLGLTLTALVTRKRSATRL